MIKALPVVSDMTFARSTWFLLVHVSFSLNVAILLSPVSLSLHLLYFSISSYSLYSYVCNMLMLRKGASIGRIKYTDYLVDRLFILCHALCLRFYPSSFIVLALNVVVFGTRSFLDRSGLVLRGIN